MACQHLIELYEICRRNGLRLSSSDLIHIACPHCGVEEVCPSILYEDYEKRHPGEESSQGNPDRE